jgi:hypothetical protein
MLRLFYQGPYSQYFIFSVTFQPVAFTYKHMMIMNDNSSVVGEQSFQLIDNTRCIIYDRRMFIIQATGVM